MADEQDEQPVKLNIHQRMIAAMRRVKYIQKERKQELKYSAVTHDAVTAKCREALMESGIYAYPEINHIEHSEFMASVGAWENGQKTMVDKPYMAMLVRIDMHFVNVDDPEDRVTVPSVGIGVDNKLNQDKCPGKAISYAVKYAYLKGLGLETGDDPDMEQNRGEEEAEPERQERAPRRVKPKQKPGEPAPPPDSTPQHIALLRQKFKDYCIKRSMKENRELAGVLAEEKHYMMERFGIKSADDCNEKQASELIDYFDGEIDKMEGR